MVLRMMLKTPHSSRGQKTESEQYQAVTHRAKHKFQWSRGTATCSCGRWTLWGANLESAKRSHALHRANLPDMAIGTDQVPGGAS